MLGHVLFHELRIHYKEFLLRREHTLVFLKKDNQLKLFREVITIYTASTKHNVWAKCRFFEC